MVSFYFPTLFIFKWFPYAILKLKPHEHQNPSLLIIETLKKTTIPQMIDFRLNSLFKKKKNIILDSSQGDLPPMSPCPPINNNQGLPLINQPPCP